MARRGVHRLPNEAGVRGADPRAMENPRITSTPPKLNYGLPWCLRGIASRILPKLRMLKSLAKKTVVWNKHSAGAARWRVPPQTRGTVSTSGERADAKPRVRWADRTLREKRHPVNPRGSDPRYSGVSRSNKGCCILSSKEVGRSVRKQLLCRKM